MLKITNENINFETLANRDIYNVETINRAENADILFLPSPEISEGVGRAFQPDTINLYKWAKQHESGIKIELLENKGEEKVLALHSFDIWIPIIYICNSLLVPIVVNLVSNYVEDKLRGTKDTANVHFTLFVENKQKGISKRIEFEGSSEVFKESFEKMNINQMWEQE